MDTTPWQRWWDQQDAAAKAALVEARRGNGLLPRRFHDSVRRAGLCTGSASAGGWAIPRPLAEAMDRDAQRSAAG